MYEAYDGLIFDMDGTILDTEPAHREAWRQVMAQYGMPFDAQAVIGLNGSPTWRIAQALVEGQHCDLDYHRLAAEKTARLKTLVFDAVQPLPLIDVAKAWFGRRPLAVGTGSEHALAESLLQHLGLRHLFTAIVAADDVKRHKPEPDTFIRCAELMGVAPERCIVFEDADFGLQAARAAGMDAVDVRLL